MQMILFILWIALFTNSVSHKLTFTNIYTQSHFLSQSIHLRAAGSSSFWDRDDDEIIAVCTCQLQKVATFVWFWEMSLSINFGTLFISTFIEIIGQYSINHFILDESKAWVILKTWKAYYQLFVSQYVHWFEKIQCGYFERNVNGSLFKTMQVNQGRIRRVSTQLFPKNRTPIELSKTVRHDSSVQRQRLKSPRIAKENRYRQEKC